METTVLIFKEIGEVERMSTNFSLKGNFLATYHRICLKKSRKFLPFHYKITVFCPISKKQNSRF